jgi:hypothetical protein
LFVARVKLTSAIAGESPVEAAPPVESISMRGAN